MPGNPHSRPGRPAPRQAGGSPIAGAIGSLILFAIAFFTFRFGLGAGLAQYFEYVNRSGVNVTIGALGFNDPASPYRILIGPEAIYWAISFCALGVMFGLWGLGMVAASCRDRKKAGQPSAVGRGIAWLSFISLLLAILCLFPPWRLGSVLFYAVSILVIGTVVHSRRTRRFELPKKVIPGVIIAAILAGNFHLGSLSIDIALALLAMFFAGIHVLMLAPHLMKRLPGEKEPDAPSLNFDE